MDHGYRTYLYFVGTENAKVNIIRVQNRFKMGGHNVSENRISDRYSRVMTLLPSIIKLTDRAFIFDNTYESTPNLIAEASRSEDSFLDLRKKQFQNGSTNI